MVSQICTINDANIERLKSIRANSTLNKNKLFNVKNIPLSLWNVLVTGKKASGTATWMFLDNSYENF